MSHKRDFVPSSRRVASALAFDHCDEVVEVALSDVDRLAVPFFFLWVVLGTVGVWVVAVVKYSLYIGIGIDIGAADADCCLSLQTIEWLSSWK